jgi:itaconate CoA-transferase
MNKYQIEYNNKLTTPAKALELLENGDVIVHSMCVAEPEKLLNAYADRVRAGNLENTSVYTMIPLQHARNSYLADDVIDKINVNTMFASAFDRDRVREGLSHFVPNEFYQIPRLTTEFIDMNVALISVSPMDEHGYFTFGVSNDYTTTVARKAKKLIVEVNKNMPRVFGDSILHISEIDAIIENDIELLDFLSHKADPISEIIGDKLAEMIPNGATIQLGVGSIPSAVTHKLVNHKNLGIHTEIFCPEMIQLIESGAANGKYKTIHPRKHTFTFAQGNKKLYDFINNNPSVESYPVSFLNDPKIIEQQHKMVSINGTLQVDLFGQCNSEYINGSQYSATGGQLDFVRGAFNSKGGMSIIAFVSVTKNKTISRIVPRLDAGTVVTVPRADVHYLATEYGVVNLKGKNLKERAEALIGLAHPNFREELLYEAKQMKLIR